MLHRHRYLILNILLVTATALFCIFSPEFLLAMEKNSDTGTVQRGKNQYYADDVSDDSIMGANFQKRLMMLSGDWKCEREVVPEDADLLSERDMRKIAVSMPALLMQAFDELDNGYGDYWSPLLGDELYIANAYSSMDLFNPDSGVEMNQEVPESMESRAAEGSFPYYINVYYAALFDMGTAKLYKYTDSIFDVNNFYMWDYTLESERLNIYYNFKIDAVTLDVYSISIHGGILDKFSWDYALNQPINYIREKGSSIMREFEQFMWFRMDEVPLVYPLAYSTLLYRDYENWNINGVRAYDRGPQGYTYQNGNFLRHVDNAEPFDSNIVKLESGGQTIYACNLEQGGYDFFYTTDETEARTAKTNPFYDYDPNK